MTTVSAIPNKTIHAIDDVTICLARKDGASPFDYTYENVAKVDPDTGKCPEPFLPCSDLTKD